MVRFSNGDQLSGEVKSLTLEKLVWNSQILKEPAEFDLKHVVDLTIPASIEKQEQVVAAHEATLALTNGDSVSGQLTALGDEEIRLKTWYAGELVFRRVNVKSVTIEQAADFHYRGPNSMEEWTASDAGSNWTFKNGALHSSGAGGLAREIDFPQECKISFDAAWRGSFRPRIIFYSGNIKTNSPEGGYEMVFQGNSVHVKKAGSNDWLGHSTNAGDLRENEKAHIEIRASVKTGKILLFVDGQYIDMWEDADINTEALGKGFHIISQDSTPMRFSAITVTTWDGYVDDLPDRQARLRNRAFRGGFDFVDDDGEEETPEKEEAVPEGRMVLRNGDTIEGEVSGINGDEITLKTPLSEVKIPIQRLKNLILKKADMETPKLYAGDIRATLADGSRIVFRLERVEGEALVGFSQNFGEARFQRSAFKRIEFNIHDKKMTALRAVDDW